jgi:hypothetical protein
MRNQKRRDSSESERLFNAIEKLGRWPSADAEGLFWRHARREHAGTSAANRSVLSVPFKRPCRNFGGPIGLHFSSCPSCGKRQHDGDVSFRDPIWIAVLGLLVIGPFVLPLVWRLKRMGQGTRLAYTGVFVVGTVITVEYLMQAIAYGLGIMEKRNGPIY